MKLRQALKLWYNSLCYLYHNDDHPTTKRATHRFTIYSRSQRRKGYTKPLKFRLKEVRQNGSMELFQHFN